MSVTCVRCKNVFILDKIKDRYCPLCKTKNISWDLPLLLKEMEEKDKEIQTLKQHIIDIATASDLGRPQDVYDEISKVQNKYQIVNGVWKG